MDLDARLAAFRGIHPGLSCAALCFIWSAAADTPTPAGSRGTAKCVPTPVCGLLFTVRLECFFVFFLQLPCVTLRTAAEPLLLDRRGFFPQADQISGFFLIQKHIVKIIISGITRYCWEADVPIFSHISNVKQQVCVTAM